MNSLIDRMTDRLDHLYEFDREPVSREKLQGRARFAGLLTTGLSCFPIFFMKLLDYVAIYGLILMPIGAIVFAEHWIFPRLKIEQFQAGKRKALFNWKALAVWIGGLVVCSLLPLHLFFRWLPGYVLVLSAYVVLHLIGKRKTIIFFTGEEGR